MKDPAIWLGFLLASIMALLQSALFPQIALLAYAPFLALACMRLSFAAALWAAAFSGLCCDFLSADPFGIHSFAAVLSAACAYQLRNRFFQDEPPYICFFTACVSFFFTPLQIVLLFLFDKRAPLSGKWEFLDFFMMPLLDAAYAFFWFVGPLLLFNWLKRQWKFVKRHG